jgi:hypothetical protein
LSDPELVLDVLLGGVRVGAELAPGYVLGGVSTAHGLELTIRAADGCFVVWARRAERCRACYRRTDRFAVGYSGARLGAAGLRVVDDLVALIARGEGALAPVDYERLVASVSTEGELAGTLPLEWLAAMTGLKPAVRQLGAQARAGEVTALAREAGLHVIALPAAAYVARFGTDPPAGDTLFFFARDPAAAAVACAAESALIAVERERDAGSTAWQDRLQAHTRELGLALGYPPCCIDFFLEHRDEPNEARRLVAARRTLSAPSYLLNNFDFGSSLVSHFVCRYDCPPSLAYARGLLTELERRDPVRAGALVQAWRAPRVLHDGSDHLRVEFAWSPSIPV